MILVWGLSGDTPTESVGEALARIGAPSIFFDQETAIHAETVFSMNGGELRWTIATPTQDIDLASVTAVYFRPYDPRQLLGARGFPQGSKEWERSLRADEALASWSEITDALVVNRPSKMAMNSSKPYQASVIRSLGFAIPDTLVTTDPKAVVEFLERHDRIIYKSVSGVRSIVSSFTREHMARLDDISWCPTQFQEYVHGIDYRVHVVGDEVYACKVISDADDYRYASRQGRDVRIEACELTLGVADRCIAMSAEMGLAVSGIDLRQSENGALYCFEVNPSPGFTYYQEKTKQPIADSIARLLAGGLKSDSKYVGS